MRIGRLEFGKVSGQYHWGFSKGSCKCAMLDIGPFYVTFLDRDCKCSECNEYTCKCVDVFCTDCQEFDNDCCCEVW